ncbi:hypothetical protein F4824DRAFT_458593 [Ustulina deusta]|nr:hypothetical protein F4824DRAFT_458593 [Ustulina deusta]
MVIPLIILRSKFSQLLVGGEAILYTLRWSRVGRSLMYLTSLALTVIVQPAEVGNSQCSLLPTDPKMLLRLFFGAATFSGLASATTVTFVSWTSTSTCSYQLESGGVPPNKLSNVIPRLHG